MEIYKILRIEREKKKISRKKIAEKLYISDGTYRDIETGKIRLSLENFLSICSILNISPMELLKENENDHYILISNQDLQDLNRIVNKINNQTINSQKNDNIPIGNNNNIKNSFNKR